MRDSRLPLLGLLAALIAVGALALYLKVHSTDDNQVAMRLVRETPVGMVEKTAKSSGTDVAVESHASQAEEKPAKTEPLVSKKEQKKSPVIQPVDALARQGTGGGGGGSKKPPIEDPTARVALSLVGVDSDAEDYWLGAINDPTLPAEERKDLIEDLNEDGLSDPKHPGPQDLPIIQSRLAIIQQEMPNAMDKVNYDAFVEAYKDLQNLGNLAMGGGEPVK